MRRVLGWLALGLGALAGLLVAARTPDIPAEVLRARYAGPTSRFVEVAPGFTVHLRDEGPRGAPTLVLLHGSNASLHTWEPWVDALRADHRVVTLDLQGHGLTGPHPQRCYTGTCMAETVEAVRRHLGLDRIVVGGNSMGGLVALRYALHHPQHVAALILIDAAGAPLPGRTRPLGFRIATLPGLRNLAEWVTPRSLIARSLEASVAVKDAASPDKVDRYWELLRHPGNRRATIERFQSPREPLDPARLRALAPVPTLILWGQEDRLFPPAAAEWFRSVLPTAELVVLNGVGHLPQEEAPAASAAVVRAFLGRRLAPAPTPPT
ncbi:MAG: alpha/beta hydrolase [Sphingomonadaceae bacterium]|uniref:alpha/beta fold hydrolase n=1 Tax=Thermaurantiacus sp. TaxID=2820283 RepID=UPI00298F1E65|nr:alpha/beta hydrolase [Thermaurantiacus sp.]MCS6987341.1 alpha/beta hydrolase [Sphingomonadaceae bacterium]MDW8414562.1 alpha/beta hydrolase [Thermaurantiacus sp.]